METQLHFYWDIYLILNFVMNLFLLGMTSLIRRKILRKKRVILASFGGSALMTGATMLWLRSCIARGGSGSVLLCLAALFIALGMVKVVFAETGWREGVRDLGTFLGVSLLTGGAVLFGLEWFGGYEIPRLWLVLTGGLGVGAVLLVIQHLNKNAEGQRHVMDGIMYGADGEAYTIRVMLDTGNQLVSPYTGEKVMILSKELADRMQLAKTGMPLQIPYHSIGGDGLMPAYRIPKLVLQNGVILQDFLAAVSSQLSVDQGIQMIISPV